MPHRHSKANPIRNTNLFFSVHHFKIAPTSAASLTDRPDQSYQSSLRDLIIRRRNALLLAFEAVDLSGSGLVTRLQWSEIMQLVTTIKMRWLSIINSIAPANSVTPTAVDYKAFLLAYPTHVYPSGLGRSSPSTSPPSSGIFLTGEGQIQEIGTGSEISGLGASGSLFDGIYLQRSRLESVFSYFDTDDDGVRTTLNRFPSHTSQRISITYSSTDCLHIPDTRFFSHTPQLISIRPGGFLRGVSRRLRAAEFATAGGAEAARHRRHDRSHRLRRQRIDIRQ